MAEMPIYRVEGLSLDDIGLDDALVVFDNGDFTRLTGFTQKPGEGIVASLLHSLPPGACVLFDVNRSLFINELRLH